MNTINTYHVASHGIQQGMQEIARNFAQLASSKQLEGKSDSIQPIIESQINRASIKANVKVLAAVDDTIGTLLDITA
ncbi:conserved hypothetical protein [Gammaproteobacteria bacterium]